MVRKAARTGPSGATFYDYEYALDSTRGRKQILNTVTIAGSRLYILNANYKCDKAASAESSGEGGVTQSGGSSSSAACGGSPTALGAMAALRAAAASFDLLLN